jgi:hemerythrin-like metal-binding protein
MSSFFEWDPARYALGIVEMDREHQEIVGHMNRLHQLHAAAAPRAQLRRVLDDLVATTRRHFADEEAYMAKIGFAGLQGHKLIHRGLLEKIGTYHAAFAGGATLGDDFFAFLSMWLKAHICGIDFKYSEFRKAA